MANKLSAGEILEKNSPNQASLRTLWGKPSLKLRIWGFRPGRSCHDAIGAIFNAIKVH